MPIEVGANNAATTLNGAIDNSTTTVVVTTGSVFPATGNFRLIVGSEIMLCTARSTNTLTVVRGSEGTAAASHSDLDPITLVLTYGALLQYFLDYGMSPACLADRKPATPGTYDEEFEGTADTLPSNWSWASAPSGSDEWTLNSRWPSLLTVEGTGSGSYRLTRASFTPGAGNFGLWAKVYNGPSTGSAVCDFRMYIFNSGKTEGRAIELYQPDTASTNVRGLKTVSNSESAWSSAVQQTLSQTGMYVGLTRSSADLWTAWYSLNGISWQWLSPQETHSFTVDKIEFRLETGAKQSLSGLAWVRSRADLLFPRP